MNLFVFDVGSVIDPDERDKRSHLQHNDHCKNWRHVYKSLVLLYYLIKNGNEKVAQQCKEHIVQIQTLKDFQYIEVS